MNIFQITSVAYILYSIFVRNIIIQSSDIPILSCSPNCTSRIVQNICCICVQSKAGCAFVETKSWSRRRKGKMTMNLLIIMKSLNSVTIAFENNRFIHSYSNTNTNIYWEWKVGYLGLPRDICLQTRRT